MRQSPRWIVLQALWLSLLLMAVVAAPAAAKLAGSEVRLGLLAPLSGFAGKYGQQDQIAMKMAEEEINGKGGIGGLPVKFIVYDTAGKNEQAASLVKRLAESDKVLAILGPWLSGECNVAFPVANRYKIPAISSSSGAPGISAQNRPWAFRTTMTAERGLERAFTKFLEKFPVKTVSIIFDNSDFLMKVEGTQLFPALLQKKGVTLVSSITYQKGDIDFGAHVTKVKNQNPDAVMLAGFYTEVSNVIRTMRTQGMKQPAYIGIGSSTPSFPSVCGSPCEGTMNSQDFWRDDPRPEVQAFVKRYEERSSGLPTPYPAVNLYDTINILKHLIETRGVTNRPEDLEKDRERLRDGLATLKGFKGIGGEISIDPNGDAIKETYPMIVRGGRWMVVE